MSSDLFDFDNRRAPRPVAPPGKRLRDQDHVGAAPIPPKLGMAPFVIGAIVAGFWINAIVWIVAQVSK